MQGAVDIALKEMVARLVVFRSYGLLYPDQGLQVTLVPIARQRLAIALRLGKKLGANPQNNHGQDMQQSRDPPDHAASQFRILVLRQNTGRQAGPVYSARPRG